ncbi:MAG TPA: 50S ribosomal protein L2 [Patescibacteria group bacterium]|nr:50S ribosomal protein L2 [Patescibacteria group bacterium]
MIIGSLSKRRFVLKKHSGRSKGKVTVRHQGGRNKRFFREIDFNRHIKEGVQGTVVAIEVDPNRNARIALVHYTDGDKRYIIAPNGLKIGQKVMASENASLEIGNATALSKIIIGTQIHNIEISPNKGGQIVRGAGSVAILQGKEDYYVLVKMPSGEIKRFNPQSWASIGQVGNIEVANQRIRKAGINIRRGIRPTVRGVAQDPHSHPHGGGEGRSGVGLKYPKTPWGKPAVGKTRRHGKYSDKLVVSGRKLGKHH